MIQKYKKLIITVIVIIAAFFVYGKFFAKDSSSGPLLGSTQSNTPENSADVLGADIIRAINQIDSLSLDRSVFSNPVLLELVDRSETIQTEDVGKPNPFSPIGVSSSNSQNLNATSTESTE